MRAIENFLNALWLIISSTTRSYWEHKTRRRAARLQSEAPKDVAQRPLGIVTEVRDQATVAAYRVHPEQRPLNNRPRG